MTHDNKRLDENAPRKISASLHAMAVERNPVLEKEDLQRLQWVSKNIGYTFETARALRKVINGHIFFTRQYYTKDPSRQLKYQIEALSLSSEEKTRDFKEYMESEVFVSIPVLKINAKGESEVQELSTCLAEFLGVIEFSGQKEAISLAHIMDDNKWEKIKAALKTKVNKPFSDEENAKDLMPGYFMPFTLNDEKKFKALLDNRQTSQAAKSEAPQTLASCTRKYSIRVK